jgi:hypothetical protein
VGSERLAGGASPARSRVNPPKPKPGLQEVQYEATVPNVVDRVVCKAVRQVLEGRINQLINAVDVTARREIR